MATPITTKQMKALTEETLNDALDAIRSRRWVVLVDYDQSEMRWRIGKVEPWHVFGEYHATRTIRIDDAPDELGAYAQALAILERAK